MAIHSKKSTLVTDTLTLLSLLGEYHAPIQTLGYSSRKGIVLCNASPDGTDFFIDSILKLQDVMEVTSISRKNLSIPNNCLGLHILQRYENLETTGNFLSQDSFQPLVICSGFVPEELTDFADTITLPFAKLTVNTDSFLELAACKQFFREHPETLRTALTHAISSEIFHVAKLQRKKIPILIERLTIAMEIYLFWYRTTYDEAKTQIRKSSLGNSFLVLIKKHLNCPNTVDIADAFIEIFYNFLDNHNDISYCPVNQIEGVAIKRLQEGRTLLWDQKYYFLSEALCREICRPLLQEHGWLTICRNLVREGIIEPDFNQQSNFSRKKVILNAYGENKRLRFFYVPKEALHTLNHLTPEERREINA